MGMRIFGTARDRQRDIYESSQLQLVWRAFLKHRLAVASLVVLVIIYLSAVFCEFVAPNDPYEIAMRYAYAPPQRLRFFDENGVFHLRPFVYGYEVSRDPISLRRLYAVDPTAKHPIRFLMRGHSYQLFRLFRTDLHLFGVDDSRVFLFGTDQNGRCMFSRVLYGARISTSIGLVGVFFSFVLGITIGGFSGYFGGLFDHLVQRLIEMLRSIPTIPLWMGLSAALPVTWPQMWVYFAITIILSLVGWTGLAREVRSKFISLREEDFVTSARIAGSSETRIVFYHMLPSFMSHIIASITLAIPGMILGETALSFLGLGLREPLISWGVLLQGAQNIRSVALYPWLLLPGLAIIITVLTFNFLGDGLRDAADPYGK